MALAARGATMAVTFSISDITELAATRSSSSTMCTTEARLQGL